MLQIAQALHGLKVHPPLVRLCASQRMKRHGQTYRPARQSFEGSARQSCPASPAEQSRDGPRQSTQELAQQHAGDRARTLPADESQAEPTETNKSDDSASIDLIA